jgi:hypothetical protein
MSDTPVFPLPPFVQGIMFGDYDGRGSFDLTQKRVLEIEIRGNNPPVQEAHMARVTAKGRCVSYDPCLGSKREMRENLRASLVDTGPSPGFPIFKGRTALKMWVTYESTNLRENATDLQAFLEDVLEGVVYENRNLLYEVHVKKTRPEDPREPVTYIKFERLVPEST